MTHVVMSFKGQINQVKIKKEPLKICRDGISDTRYIGDLNANTLTGCAKNKRREKIEKINFLYFIM